MQETYESQVTLPRDYFAKAKREYSNWVFSWWREATQNSVDSGAKNIHFTIDVDEKGQIVVSCKDDGCGMSESVLRDVFLALGGTNKGNGATGGFGYAKVILLFAHLKYQIRSNEFVVNGEGGNYTLATSDTPIKGTIITVVIGDSSTVTNVRNQLIDFLNHSTVSDVKFSINGESHKIKEIIHAYKVDTSIGLLQFSDCSRDYSRLAIRVNGLAMFYHDVFVSSSSTFTGTLDLNRPSIEILTSNRDSLIGEYSRTLNDITTTLGNERTTLKLSNLMSFVLNPRATVEQAPLDVEPSDDHEVAGKAHLAHTGNVSHTGGAAYPLPVNADPFALLKKESALAAESLEERLSKIDCHVYPEQFTIYTTPTSKEDITQGNKKIAVLTKELNLRRTKKLAWVWDTLIHALLETRWASIMGVRSYGSEGYDLIHMFLGREIRTGFVYSPDVRGLCSRNENEYTIYLNPTLLDPDYTFEDLLDIAIHELTHLDISGHDESFCSSEMDLRKSVRLSYKGSSLKNRCLAAFK